MSFGRGAADRVAWLAPLVALALLYLYGVADLLAAPPGHDQSWYLFAAQRMLSGAKLYGPRLSETNPPLIVWFSTLPILFSRWVRVSPTAALRLLVLVLVFGSMVWCIRVSRLNRKTANPVFLGLWAFAILFIGFRTGTYNFGQREQLFVLFALPYIMAAATGTVRQLSYTERVALGLAAGIAICFKPQDVLVVAGFELFLAARMRSLRRILAPEFLALLATCGFYLLLIRTFTPLYLRDVLPLLVNTYWAYGTSSAFGLAFSLKVFTAEVVATLLACFFLRRSSDASITTISLLVCSIAASIAYDIQHTNWDYHAYPFRAFLLLAVAYLFIDLLAPAIIRLTTSPHLNKRLVPGVLALLAISVAIAAHRRNQFLIRQRSGNSELGHFLAQYHAPKTVYIFSTSLYPFPIVFEHGLNWGSRFAHLWMLPAIIQNEVGPTGPPAPFKPLPQATVAELATLQRKQSAEDLNYWKPSVVLVEHCTVHDPCQAIEGKNFDMISWFLQAPEFAVAWSHYQRQQGTPSSFDLYTRVP